MSIAIATQDNLIRTLSGRRDEGSFTSKHLATKDLCDAGRHMFAPPAQLIFVSFADFPEAESESMYGGSGSRTASE